jgi:hypothetical protein
MKMLTGPGRKCRQRADIRVAERLVQPGDVGAGVGAEVVEGSDLGGNATAVGGVAIGPVIDRTGASATVAACRTRWSRVLPTWSTVAGTRRR